MSTCCLVCPCLTRNPTSRLIYKEGATIIFTLKSLLQQNLLEWDQNIDVNFPGNPQMYAAHGDIKRADLRKLRRDLHQQKYVHSDGGIPLGIEDLVVLTTSGSYHGYVAKEMRLASSGRLTKNTWDGIAWGAVLRDKSYLCVDCGNQQFWLMRSFNEGLENRHRPWLFAFTRTLLSSGLKGLEAWAILQYEHIAKRVGWDKEPGLKMVNKDWFADDERLFRDFLRLEFNTPEYKEMRTKLGQRVGPFLKMFMVRHYASTKIDGEPLVRLPPLGISRYQLQYRSCSTMRSNVMAFQSRHERHRC
jgi:hypothetical protein